MPELPEVETIKRDLCRRITDLVIEDIKVFDRRVIKDLKPTVFIKQLTGQTIKVVERRGKALVFHLSRGYLVVQLKMTGQLIYTSCPQTPGRDLKVVFALSNGDYLHYNDQRTFGWLIFAQNFSTIPFLHSLGPEPLSESFSIEAFEARLRNRKAPIKTLLMNQEVVAGIGNIYASEILFTARIHPEKSAGALEQAEVRALHSAAVAVLKEAVRFRGCSMRNYRDSAGEKGKYMSRIKVYGRGGDQCLNCRALISRSVQAGRSTFYCKVCQK